jgi:hypothetical protein
MNRDIFRKVPLSEKKALFRKACLEQIVFVAKGGRDELVSLYLAEYVDLKILIFEYASNSIQFSEAQKIVINFSVGEDRYFMNAKADLIGDRVHVSAESDVFILQRRKSPRLDLPDSYPGSLNIISYKGKACLYQCKISDFGSGGCRVQYQGHLPQFKSGETFRGVIHLNHRIPVELACEIKHHVTGPADGFQTFGVRFRLDTSILENKLLVVFMHLQRELFVKWSSSESS